MQYSCEAASHQDALQRMRGRRDAWMGREGWSGRRAGAAAGSRITWNQPMRSVVKLVRHRLVEVVFGDQHGLGRIERRRLIEEKVALRRSRRRRRAGPTRAPDVRKKFGVEPPKRARKKSKPHASVPRTVRIGRRHRGCREIRLDRKELYDRLWTEPVSKVAEAWDSPTTASGSSAAG